MPIEIQIPNRTHETFGDSLNKLINVVNQICSTTEKEIVIDFSHARMLNPFFLGGLLCTVNRHREDGKDIVLKYKDNPNISSYLNTIYFGETFRPTGASELNTLEKYKNKSFIPITTFCTGSATEITTERERVLTAISTLLKNQLNFTEKERMPLAYFLGELTDNINEHANVKNGYVFAQYYGSSNYLDLCICDSGRGILKSYLESMKYNPSSEVEAMQMAVTGRSTKDQEQRGYGISTTRNMLVKGLRGKLFIWSGQTAFIQSIDKEAVTALGANDNFKGTFVALRLPTLSPGTFNFYDFIEA